MWAYTSALAEWVEQHLMVTAADELLSALAGRTVNILSAAQGAESLS